MRGSDDLLKATFAFRYFNDFTALFPIRVKILPTENGTWVADMLVGRRTSLPVLPLTCCSSQTMTRIQA